MMLFFLKNIHIKISDFFSIDGHATSIVQQKKTNGPQVFHCLNDPKFGGKCKTTLLDGKWQTSGYLQLMYHIMEGTKLDYIAPT